MPPRVCFINVQTDGWNIPVHPVLLLTHWTIVTQCIRDVLPTGLGPDVLLSSVQTMLSLSPVSNMYTDCE